MFPETLEFSEATQELEDDDLLLYNGTSYLYDFKKGDFIYENGNPVLVKGVEALRIWVEKIVRTKIYTYEIYDERDDDGFLTRRGYGTKLWSITKGRKLPELIIHAETKRDIEEALSMNDKIKRIEDYKLEQGVCGSSHMLKISFTVVTVDNEDNFLMEVNI